MNEHLGEIGLLLILLAIGVLVIPGLLGFASTWSLIIGIWIGIVAVFFLRADRARGERRERREDRREE